MNVNSTIKPFLIKDLIKPSSEGKLVLLGSEIKWLSKDELAKPENKKIKTSLKPIVKIAQNANISNLSEREYENVVSNFKQINTRIKNYNEKINNSTIKKAINSFLSFISGGHLKLTYDTLDAEITAVERKKLAEKKVLENKISNALSNRTQLYNPGLALSLIEGAVKFDLSPAAFSNFKELMQDFPSSVVSNDLDKLIPSLFEKIEKSGLSQEDFNDFLLALNDEMFLLYYADKSFMEANGLHGATVSDVHLVPVEQQIVLERLFTLSHEKTLLELKESPFLRQLLTETLNRYTTLEYQPDTFVKSLKAALDKITQIGLPQEEMTHFLLGLNDQMLSFFYSDKSFVKENHLEDLTVEDITKITDEQKALLSRLFFLSSKETLLDLQKSPILRNLLIELFQTYPEFANRDPVELKLFLDETLQKIHGLSKFIETDCLLKVLMFVSQNWDKITTGTIGKMSVSRPHIRKIEANPLLPEDIEYDTKKGDIIVKLGVLGKGAFNIVKKGLVLQNMQMRAFRKPIEAKNKTDSKEPEKIAKIDEDIAKMSEQEKKIMLAAKGLPHVVQFHEVYEYTSAKKKTGVMRMELPLYNLGEMQEHLKAIRSNKLDALQISFDMIKGVLGLHERGIIHRDLKPGNIFLDGTFENGKVVKHANVGDLGLSCFIDGDSSRKSLAGTRLYLSPESLDQDYVADFSQDAWAMGVMLSQIFKEKSPFVDIKNTYQQIQLFMRLGNPIQNPEPADKTSIDFVIWKLLQPDPAKRMTLAEALPIIEANLTAEKQKPKTVNV